MNQNNDNHLTGDNVITSNNLKSRVEIVKGGHTTILKSNRQWADLYYFSDLPDDRKKDFRCCKPGTTECGNVAGTPNCKGCPEKCFCEDCADSDGYVKWAYETEYVKHKDYYYPLEEFMVLPEGDLSSLGWTAYNGESAFSGILIELSPDGQSYRVGRWYC